MFVVIFSVMFYSKPYVIGCKLITSLLNLLALLDLLLLVSESLSDILGELYRGIQRHNQFLSRAFGVLLLSLQLKACVL